MSIMVETAGENLELQLDEFSIGMDKPLRYDGSVGSQVPVSSLTKVIGDVNFTADGQIIEGLDITGKVNFGNTINSKLRNCIVRVGPSVYGTTRPAIGSYGTRASGRLVEFVTVEPSHPSVDIYGITGYGFKAIRSLFTEVVDIAQINHGGDFTGGKLWGCFGETVQYDVDPRQGNGPSHGDFVQIFGGSEVDVWGNRFVGEPQKSNGVIFTPSTVNSASAVSNPKVRQNWLSGTYTQITAWSNPSGSSFIPINGLTITGNRHIGTQGNIPADHRWEILLTQENWNRRTDISGNVRDSTGAAAHVYINN